jgi:hypothetical protein
MARTVQSLEQFFNCMQRPVRTDLADADREQPVEEVVLRRGGLEARQRAELTIRIVAHAGERSPSNAPPVMGKGATSSDAQRTSSIVFIASRSA